MSFIKNNINSVLGRIGFKVVKIESQKRTFNSKANKVLQIDLGHRLSKESKESIDGGKNPIPWFTYPSIEYMKQLDLSEKVMLEWGAGNSSLFFSKSVKTLYSIEHNREWFEKVKKDNIQNQILIHAESDYVKRPKTLKVDFDIILIDGIEREACALEVFDILNEGGMVILDNSDRHPDIAENFRNSNFIEVDFHGFGPINDYTWTTSVFMHRSFNFKPLSIQPTIPIGGGF